jgi:hypothetical protein
LAIILVLQITRVKIVVTPRTPILILTNPSKSVGIVFVGAELGYIVKQLHTGQGSASVEGIPIQDGVPFVKK